MTDDVDVVVVGARVSGATLATLLARRGLRVSLIDKARLPSDIASTHIVQPFGVAVLQRLGVYDELRRRGAAQFERVSLTYEGACLEAAYADARDLSTGSTPGLNARRVVLDDVLLTAARAAGVEVCTSSAVDDLVADRSGRVCGVRAGDRTVTARVVVGADGRDSTIARLAGAREYAAYPAPRFAVWGYFAGSADDAGRLRIGRLGHRAWISCPTDDGLTLVGVVPDTAEKDRFLEARERSFRDYARHWSALAPLMSDAERVGPLRTVSNWHGFFREAAGPGWVLTGDAGNFKDPSAAQGIADALRQAERLAGVLTNGLAPGGDVDRGTARFWRWRDRDCRAMHWFALDMGAAGTTRPVTAQAVRDVAGDPIAGEQFLRVLNRDLPPRGLLTRRRLARSAARAMRSAPDAVSRRAVLGEVGAGIGDEIRRLRPARP